MLWTGVYLTDDQLLETLKKFKDALNDDGFILYKDNYTENKEFFLY